MPLTMLEGLDEQRALAWTAAGGRVRELADSVGALSTAPFSLLQFHPIKFDGDRVKWWDAWRRVWGPAWTATIVKAEDSGYLALVAPATTERTMMMKYRLFVETHSQLATWWLTTLWRAVELVDAAWEAADRSLTAAAALVRPLVETAAAFWNTGRRAAALWNAAKDDPSDAGAADRAYFELRTLLFPELQQGRFDSRYPEGKAFGQIAPTNAITHVKHLSKVMSYDLYRDYEWLCNVVHPSVGARVVYFGTPQTHESRAFTQIGVVHERARSSALIREVIADAAVSAVKVLAVSMDAMLRILDDVCLTVNVADLGGPDSWRVLRVSSRNDPCPCRSGRKAKLCHHDWTSPAPEFPSAFILPYTPSPIGPDFEC